MAVDDRDPKFERALARELRGDSAQAGCPDAETLAAYHERSLSLEEMAHWKQHISGCAAVPGGAVAGGSDGKRVGGRLGAAGDSGAGGWGGCAARSH